MALRSHAAAVVSTVDSITGDTTTGKEKFTAGDPLIGQPVNLGPDRRKWCLTFEPSLLNCLRFFTLGGSDASDGSDGLVGGAYE